MYRAWCFWGDYNKWGGGGVDHYVITLLGTDVTLSQVHKHAALVKYKCFILTISSMVAISLCRLSGVVGVSDVLFRHSLL